MEKKMEIAIIHWGYMWDNVFEVWVLGLRVYGFKGLRF